MSCTRYYITCTASCMLMSAALLALRTTRTGGFVIQICNSSSSLDLGCRSSVVNRPSRVCQTCTTKKNWSNTISTTININNTTSCFLAFCTIYPIYQWNARQIPKTVLTPPPPHLQGGEQIATRSACVFAWPHAWCVSTMHIKDGRISFKKTHLQEKFSLGLAQV